MSESLGNIDASGATADANAKNVVRRIDYSETSMRETYTSRTVMAGCFVCYGSDGKWFGGSAQGTAARHHDASGHATWADVALTVRYGEYQITASATKARP